MLRKSTRRIFPGYLGIGMRMSINRRFAIAWVIYIFLGVINYLAHDFITPVASVIGSITPSIDGLRVVSSEAYTFFGSAVLLVLPLAAFMVFKSDTNARVRDSICKSPHPVHQVLFLYALGLPMIILLLFMACILPISQMTGSGFGGQVAKLIVNGGIGLVFAGSFLLVGLTGMISIVFALLAFPALSLLNAIGGKK